MIGQPPVNELAVDHPPPLQESSSWIYSLELEKPLLPELMLTLSMEATLGGHNYIGCSQGRDKTIKTCGVVISVVRRLRYGL